MLLYYFIYILKCMQKHADVTCSDTFSYHLSMTRNTHTFSGVGCTAGFHTPEITWVHPPFSLKPALIQCLGHGHKAAGAYCLSQ